MHLVTTDDAEKTATGHARNGILSVALLKVSEFRDDASIVD